MKLKQTYLFFWCLITSTILNAQDSKPFVIKGHSNDVDAISYSQQGFIATGSFDQKINIYKADSPYQLVKTLGGHMGPVNVVAFNKNGKWLATGGEDRTIFLWDSTLTVGKKLEAHKDKINCLAFDLYGRYLYSGSDDKSLIVWDVATGKQLKSISNTQAINAIATTADLTFLYIACAEPKIKLINMMSGQVAKTLDGHTDAVNDIAISKNGKWLVSGSNDKTARVWDLSTGKQIRILPVDCWKVTTVSFSDNDKFIVTGCNDGSIKVWETESGKLLKSFVLENAITRNVIFNKDATQVFASYMLREGDDYGIRIWPTGIQPIAVIQEVKASVTTPSDTLNKIKPKNNLPTINMNHPAVKPRK